MGGGRMKIMFNGLLEKHESSGCNCKKVGSDYGFVNSRMYILPSGQTKTFYVGKAEEVSEFDGQFLLSYNQAPDANGMPREVFTKVEG